MINLAEARFWFTGEILDNVLCYEPKKSSLNKRSKHRLERIIHYD